MDRTNLSRGIMSSGLVSATTAGFQDDEQIPSVVLEWDGKGGFGDIAKPQQVPGGGPIATTSFFADLKTHIRSPKNWTRTQKIAVAAMTFFAVLGTALGVGISIAMAAQLPPSGYACPGEVCPTGECRSGATGECGFGKEFCNINTTWAISGCCPQAGSNAVHRLRFLESVERQLLSPGVPTCDNPTLSTSSSSSSSSETSDSLLRASSAPSCGNWYDYLNPCCWSKCPAGNLFDTCSLCCGCQSGLTCSSAALISGQFKTTCLKISPPTPSVSLASLSLQSDVASTPLANVRFVYAHDAMTTYFNAAILSQNFIQGVYDTALAPFVVTQQKGNVQSLLNCGARAFDMRVLQVTDSSLVTAMNAAGFPAKLNDVVFEHGPIPILYSFGQAMQDAISWSNANKGDDANLVLFFAEVCQNCAADTLSKQYQSAGIPFVSPGQLGSMTYAQALALARTMNNGGVLLGVTGTVGNQHFDETLRCRFFHSESINCFDSADPLNGMKSYIQGLLTSSHSIGDQVQALWQSPLTTAGGTTEFVLSGSNLPTDESNSALNFFMYNELIQNSAWRTGSFNLWKTDNVCDWGPKLNERFRALNGFMQTMNAPKSLSPGQALISSNGLYRFTLQADGNIVIYSELDGSAIWSPNVFSNCPVRLAMQSDCNLVAYDCNNHAYFATGTYGKAGPCFLKMQVDRNLVLYGAGGVAYWASGTFI